MTDIAEAVSSFCPGRQQLKMALAAGAVSSLTLTQPAQAADEPFRLGWTDAVQPPGFKNCAFVSVIFPGGLEPGDPRSGPMGTGARYFMSGLNEGFLNTTRSEDEYTLAFATSYVVNSWQTCNVPDPNDFLKSDRSNMVVKFPKPLQDWFNANSQLDSDGDGLTDFIEINWTKSNPDAADSNGDGHDDMQEYIKMLQFYPDGYAQWDWHGHGKTFLNDFDADGDGRSNSQELFNDCTIPIMVDQQPTTPYPAAACDFREVYQNFDSDKDGILTNEENYLGLDPNNADSNGDGMNDLEEKVKWDDIHLDFATDYDGDGIPTARDPDADNDGRNNAMEFYQGTNPAIPDAAP